MHTRITILITLDELEALRRLAQAEMRDARRQASVIIRQELYRRGLIKLEGENEGTNVSRTGSQPTN